MSVAIIKTALLTFGSYMKEEVCLHLLTVNHSYFRISQFIKHLSFEPLFIVLLKKSRWPSGIYPRYARLIQHLKIN